MYAQVVNVLTIFKFIFIIIIVNTSLIYKKSCSVFGHSKIEITKELENNLIITIICLIISSIKKKKRGCRARIMRFCLPE